MQKYFFHTSMWEKAWNCKKLSAEVFATKEGPKINSVNIFQRIWKRCDCDQSGPLGHGSLPSPAEALKLISQCCVQCQARWRSHSQHVTNTAFQSGGWRNSQWWGKLFWCSIKNKLGFLPFTSKRGDKNPRRSSLLLVFLIKTQRLRPVLFKGIKELRVYFSSEAS